MPATARGTALVAPHDRLKARLEGASPRHVVVVGAGFVGLEMVEQLVLQGLRVTLVEMASQVLAPLDAPMAARVAAELTRHGVELVLGDPMAAVLTDGTVQLKSGRVLPADGVVMGLGVRPNAALGQAAGWCTMRRTDGCWGPRP
ncbi:MAG: NAD(P)/FAD-dependent oxidoreductase [Candidatus Xenobia bacterium]